MDTEMDGHNNQNMQPVILKRAGQEDAALIADLSRRTFQEAFAAANTKEDMELFMEKQFTREGLMQEVYAGVSHFFIAYELHKPVGYVCIRPGDNLPEFAKQFSIELARIYVLQSHLGKGIGKLLMQKAIEVAIAEQKEIIWLGVWEKNERAIQFYQQWGFRRFGEHDFLLGHDVQTDWLMLKRLSEK
jgi:ribosomal protein S18 acetylase RimI-like enzyme